MLDHRVGLYQSSQDKAFTEPNCFPEELRTSKKPHCLAQNAHASSSSFKFGLPCCKKGFKVLTSTALTQCILEWEYQDLQAEQQNLPSMDSFGFPVAFRSCSTNKTKQPLHHHSPPLQLFKHKLSLSFPLNMWLPKKGKNQSGYCQNNTIFFHRQNFQQNACYFPWTQVLKKEQPQDIFKTW